MAATNCNYAPITVRQTFFHSCGASSHQCWRIMLSSILVTGAPIYQGAAEMLWLEFYKETIKRNWANTMTEFCNKNLINLPRQNFFWLWAENHIISLYIVVHGRQKWKNRSKKHNWPKISQGRLIITWFRLLIATDEKMKLSVVSARHDIFLVLHSFKKSQVAANEPTLIRHSI